MGKHVKKKGSINILESGIIEERRRPRYIFRKMLLVLFIIILASAAASYGYVKNLERKVSFAGENDGSKKIEEALSKHKNKEPISILILGNDTRGDDRGRADTIIVMRFNPEANKVVLVSIPRDFRVKIPGYSYNKINSAHAIGGVELMIRTVKDFTDIDINHYVMVDFKGFKEIVDALGGIDIYVDKRMRDSSLGISLKSGYQNLDGENALKYVRFRHDAQGDFGRIERQQKFIRAILDESVKIRSIFKVPELVNIVVENTRTDMTMSEMVSLGRQLNALEKSDFDGVMLPGTPEMRGGVSYVIPDGEEMEKIFYRVKNGLALDGELPPEFIRNKDIVLEVRNGCGASGIAHELANKLKEKDFQVKNIGNADGSDYDKTLIIYNSNAKNKADKVGICLPFADIEETDGKYDFSSDVFIIIGKDYVNAQ